MHRAWLFRWHLTWPMPPPSRIGYPCPECRLTFLRVVHKHDPVEPAQCVVGEHPRISTHELRPFSPALLPSGLSDATRSGPDSLGKLEDNLPCRRLLAQYLDRGGYRIMPESSGSGVHQHTRVGAGHRARQYERKDRCGRRAGEKGHGGRRGKRVGWACVNSRLGGGGGFRGISAGAFYEDIS